MLRVLWRAFDRRRAEVRELERQTRAVGVIEKFWGRYLEKKSGHGDRLRHEV